MNVSRLLAVALTACVLGLATCPFLYFVSGAPFDIRDTVQRSMIITSALIAGGFLLWRYLSRPSGQGARRWLNVSEAIAGWRSSTSSSLFLTCA